MKSQSLRTLLFGVVAALIGVLLLAVGFLARFAIEPSAKNPANTTAAGSGTPAAAGAQGAASVNGHTLDEILGILKTDFVEPDRVNSDYLYESAINGVFQ